MISARDEFELQLFSRANFICDGSRCEESGPRPAQRVRGAHEREGDEEILRRAHLHEISPPRARRALRDAVVAPAALEPLARSPFFLLLFNSFLEFWIGYFPKDAFNARDLTKCPEVNKIFGIEVEPRFCTPTNVDGQQDDTTGDEYKAK